ncbi:MAG: hypothetical protein WED34_20315 [Planctomycetales bacterium]
MRVASICCGMVLALGWPAIAFAQATDEAWEEVPAAPRVPVVEPPERVTQRLIHERAASRARQRTARIEARRWLRISTYRPTYPSRELIPPAYSVPWVSPYLHSPASGAILIRE